MDAIYPLFLLTVSLIGFFLAHHIFTKKRAQDTLVCPLDSNCDTVIHSRYSTLFTIPLEIWGMVYYGSVAIGYGALYFVPYAVVGELAVALVVFSAIAFLFSIYLTCVQAFVLHEWCTWCLMSAGLCIILFIVGAFSSQALGRFFLILN